jgi:RNA polymerase-binding protein DksA
MDRKTRDALENRLRERRTRLWEEAMAADSELRALAEDRESELEETAQHEDAAALITSLDVRTRREIEETDSALARIADGRYGLCTRCGSPITVARLQALPETRFCVPCAPGGRDL